MLKSLKKLFGKEPSEEVKVELKKGNDAENRNYICVPFDPDNTVNDLRVGDWNMTSVHRDLQMGMLRYAKQSEIDTAIENGKIVSNSEVRS